MTGNRRCIGLDVHREFAQVAVWQGGTVTQAATFATTPEGVREFAAGLGPGDEVALEATGNTWAIATVLASRAGRVVVSNPAKTRAIAEAKVKTDKVDAAILAQLLAADFLPPVWMPDAATSALRRQVLRRAHVVRQRTRLKNQVHAILARNLVPRCPAADLFGIKGRHWLAQQDLPPDERDAAGALLRQLDFHADELRLIDADLGRAALERPDVLRLMTIPGVDATVALSIVAAVGDFTRFRTPDKLVACLGLNPRVRQSGGQPASHGRISRSMNRITLTWSPWPGCCHGSHRGQCGSSGRATVTRSAGCSSGTATTSLARPSISTSATCLPTSSAGPSTRPGTRRY